eukprot:SAG11_NODE_992_length_6262_cov_2.097193_7_plen_56_part_00
MVALMHQYGAAALDPHTVGTVSSRRFQRCQNPKIAHLCINSGFARVRLRSRSSTD